MGSPGTLNIPGAQPHAGQSGQTLWRSGQSIGANTQANRHFKVKLCASPQGSDSTSLFSPWRRPCSRVLAHMNEDVHDSRKNCKQPKSPSPADCVNKRWFPGTVNIQQWTRMKLLMSACVSLQYWRKGCEAQSNTECAPTFNTFRC